LKEAKEAVSLMGEMAMPFYFSEREQTKAKDGGEKSLEVEELGEKGIMGETVVLEVMETAGWMEKVEVKCECNGCMKSYLIMSWRG